MGKRTQAAQDASFDKYGFDLYMRMIEAYGFANQLEDELEAIQQKDLAQPAMTELIDNPPPLPEPDSEGYVRFHSKEQIRQIEAAAFARGVAAGRNAWLEEAAKHFCAKGHGCEMFAGEIEEEIRSLKQ